MHNKKIKKCKPRTAVQSIGLQTKLSDERDYPEPHEFKPERFLKDGQLDSSVRDPMDIAFGFGRR